MPLMAPVIASKNCGEPAGFRHGAPFSAAHKTAHVSSFLSYEVKPLPVLGFEASPVSAVFLFWRRLEGGHRPCSSKARSYPSKHRLLLVLRVWGTRGRGWTATHLV